MRNKLLWLVSLGFFMQTLDSTIVNTALPAMARDMGESPLHMHSVIVAYSLAMAVLIPASGWLADRFGTRRVFMSAIGLFVLGSVLCALSPNLNLLVAARVIQGLGARCCCRWGVWRCCGPSRESSSSGPSASSRSPAWSGP